MDIRLYGTQLSLSSSLKSDQHETPQDTSSSNDSDIESDSECLDPTPNPKKSHIQHHINGQSHALSQANESTIKDGKKIFLGWSTVKIVTEHFVKCTLHKKQKKKKNDVIM